jgi:NAD(P)H-hydrate epimerase
MNRLPAELYRAEQVRELDRRAIQAHAIPGFTLMQRAAAAAFGQLRWRWPDASRLAVVCGTGNNGGDGLLLAVEALAAGRNVHVFLVGDPARLGDDARLALEAYRKSGGEPKGLGHEALQDADVVVDALLGIGLGRPLQGEQLEAVEAINRYHARGRPVMALDLPSGLDADRGEVMGAAVEADLTVSFIALKLGLFIGEGPRCAGRIFHAGLDVPPAVFDGMQPAALRIRDSTRRQLLPARPRTAYKNRHGHVLLVGGDHGTGGAIRLAAEAALRAGAGLVSVATRPAHAAMITQVRPELMCRGIEDVRDLEPMLARATVVAVGPGLGLSDWGRSLWQLLLANPLPKVVDADALNLLAREPQHRDNWILTPHPGEAARLLGGLKNDEVQADRPAAVRALASRYGGVVVLKGAGSLVQAEAGPLSVCTAGNPGMAVGGMGDLLCGLIAGLQAQGLGAQDAARVGVHIHARAGDLAAQAGGQRGLLPSDLLGLIRQLVNP